jgi:putative ABC transport system permease protein
MTLQDFRTGWRLLLKDPGHSLVMVLSLTVGFAVWFLVLGFTRYEFGFDTQVPGVQDVYVVKARPNWGRSSWSENVPYAMKESLEKSGLPLQATAVLPFQVAVRVNEVASSLELTVVDPAFVPVFGARALEGDLAAALSRPDAVALSRETALTLFGDAHAVGKRLQLNGEPVEVAAVVADPPKTSSVQFRALAGTVSSAWSAAQRERARDPWNSYAEDGKDIVGCKVYLRLQDGARRDAALAAIARDIEGSALRAHLGPRHLAELGDKPLMRVAIGPLADSYLDSDARDNSGPKGDPIANYAMNGVALLILLLTAGNYINLANIRVVQRQREMAVRKALGARPAQLAAQLLAESVLVSVLAALLGAVLARVLLPAWSDLTDHDIAGILTGADYVAFAGIVLGSGVLVGLVAGLYPTWTALRMTVTPVLSGRNGSDTAGGLLLRRVLTVLQFGIAMFVTAMIVTIAWQIQYLKGIDYGYAVDGLTIVRLPAELTTSEIAGFRTELQAQPEIRSVSGSSTRSTQLDFATSRGEPVTLATRKVGPAYFATLGLGASAGRVFDPRQDAGEGANAVVMNGLAALRLGFADPAAAVGQFVQMNGQTVQVVGISRDVRNGFIIGPPQPQVYALADRTPELLVRSARDDAATRAAVTTLWERHFPSRYLSMRNLRAQLEMNAGGPQAVLQSCVVVGVVIVPLAVFSIYVLSALMVQRRAREFVMRRLYGARPADIAGLLLREFGLLQGVAAIVALPLAYFGGRAFVERFSDQAAIGPWAVAVALLGALLVTAIATSRHILAAARLAPAQVLRAA